MAQDKSVLSQITADNEIVKRNLPLDGTCLRDKTNNYRMCCSGLVLQKH
jgi:hypothetical protein